MQRGVCDHFVDFENKLFFIFLTLSFVDESLDGFLNEFKKTKSERNFEQISEERNSCCGKKAKEKFLKRFSEIFRK